MVNEIMEQLKRKAAGSVIIWKHCTFLYVICTSQRQTNSVHCRPFLTLLSIQFPYCDKPFTCTMKTYGSLLWKSHFLEYTFKSREKEKIWRRPNKRYFEFRLVGIFLLRRIVSRLTVFIAMGPICRRNNRKESSLIWSWLNRSIGSLAVG